MSDNEIEVVDNNSNGDNEYCYCPSCGTKNKKSSIRCYSCGKPLAHVNVSSDSEIVRCPKCNSTQVALVTYQADKDFSGGKACCGFAMCGPLGILFGLDGKKTPARTMRKCKSCGNEF